ncbi:YkuS family protein [Sediminibacillus sp. JSM 1682029]|uniref:YkuS family protein n=1 Tax=Sediminibacillus sp. JSM 1682029 TaxID=3229857 RepID=UPI003524090D
MPRIGIEGTLSDVKGALQERGYELVELRQESDVQNCDCCVISGQDKNVMGMTTASTQSPVINANGMTADEVCQQVDSRFQ